MKLATRLQLALGAVILAVASLPAGLSAAQEARAPLALKAVVVEGAPAFSDGVAFTLQSLDTGEAIEVSGKSAAALDVPMGRYRLKASYGATSVEQDVLVDGKSKDFVVNLNAGGVKLRMIPAVGGREISRAIDWRVMTYGRDRKGRRVTVYESTAATADVVLPDGWYVVHALDKGKLVKHVIEVTAGTDYTYTLVRN